ncbi:sensor histidine kinase [Streptomyces sp. INA 01156]
MANLVENAVKYAPSGTTVLVAASALADRVEVRVVDRGPGVPDDAKDRIFEPFQRYGDARAVPVSASAWRWHAASWRPWAAR